MSLEKAIKKECSGYFETILLAIIMDPNAYYALQVPDSELGFALYTCVLCFCDFVIL